MTLRPAPVVALVPTRSPGAGKSRLSRELDTDQRAALGTAMLADVVAALAASSLDRIIVVAAGSKAVRAARGLGVEVVADPPPATGLDAAVAAAVERLPEGTDVLVAMADLPCLSPTDVEELLTSPAEVVVAANDDGGTGGLLRRPGSAMRTAYGPRSAAAHARLAAAAARSVEVVHIPGFGFDVDTTRDLDRLRGRTDVGARTAGFLRALDGASESAAAG